MPLHSPTTALTSAHHRSPPPFFRHFGGSLSPPTSRLHPSIMALSASPLAHHRTRFRSPPHSPSPICDFCGSLPLLRSPHRSVMAFSAHPSGTFIAFPLRSLTTALAFTHLLLLRLPTSSAVAPSFHHGILGPSLWYVHRPPGLSARSPPHSSSPICDFCSPLPTSCHYPFLMTVSASLLTTALVFTHL